LDFAELLLDFSLALLLALAFLLPLTGFAGGSIPGAQSVADWSRFEALGGLEASVFRCASDVKSAPDVSSRVLRLRLPAVRIGATREDRLSKESRSPADTSGCSSSSLADMRSSTAGAGGADRADEDAEDDEDDDEEEERPASSSMSLM